MQTIIMAKGLPGSGKTHAIRDLRRIYPSLVVVSRDSMRAMLTNQTDKRRSLGYIMEEAITTAMIGLAHTALSTGNDVYVDACNLHSNDEAVWSGVAFEAKANFQTLDLCGIPLAEVLRRNAKRTGSIPDYEIFRMHRLYFSQSS